MAKLRYNARVFEGTTAELATDTTVFRANEFIFDTTTGELKKGNGVDVYGDLSSIGAGESPVAVTWETLSGKPVVIGAGADAAAARAAIGAGTGNGTSNLALGTTAVTASAGNHNHPVTADAASGLVAAATVQALAVALSARIKALEDAAV